MSDYKYYAFDFAIGTTREIFRSNVDTPKDFGTLAYGELRRMDLGRMVPPNFGHC